MCFRSQLGSGTGEPPPPGSPQPPRLFRWLNVHGPSTVHTHIYRGGAAVTGLRWGGGQEQKSLRVQNEADAIGVSNLISLATVGPSPGCLPLGPSQDRSYIHEDFFLLDQSAGSL